MDWYLLAIISMVFYSIQGVIVKAAANKKCDSSLTIFYFLFTVFLMSLPFLFIDRFLIGGAFLVTAIGLSAALINGTFFSIASITRLIVLKILPASIVYPILRLHIAVLVVLLVLLLGETISLTNLIGISLAVLSIYLLSKGEKDEKGL